MKTILAATLATVMMAGTASAFSDTQTEFVKQFAAALFGANHCQGFAVDIEEATRESVRAGLDPRDWEKAHLKKALDAAMKRVPGAPDVCPVLWQALGPDSPTPMIGKRN